MTPIGTALLAGAFCCTASASFAQSLEGTVLSFMPPRVSNASGNASGAAPPIRHKANVYASVAADGSVPGPWIDDTSVRVHRHRIR